MEINMSFERISPRTELRRYIECFWIVEDTDPSPMIQKIIPDGFSEMIFHFGDTYLIKLDRKWTRQSWSLLGGQITSHFFLKNTGVSSILGIKFKPAAIGLLFNIDMHALTNRVVSLTGFGHLDLIAFEGLLKNTGDHSKRIAVIEDYLSNYLRVDQNEPVINAAIEQIFSSNGMVPVAEICKQCGCSERQLERMFRKYVGLSPKLYSRIIRFAYIFQLAQGRKEMNGSELGIASGYYDQSHFIKNFKAFTGEEPSEYFFDRPNLANFFLKKS
ncbi:MAG TPA: helix-turn-helix transcriptional regulator [Chryseolinea sp.]|nr:helix-turn-helix transcriptional regulator [Chryseolinea sp.]